MAGLLLFKAWFQIHENLVQVIFTLGKNDLFTDGRVFSRIIRADGSVVIVFESMIRISGLDHSLDRVFLVTRLETRFRVRLLGGKSGTSSTSPGSTWFGSDWRIMTLHMVSLVTHVTQQHQVRFLVRQVGQTFTSTACLAIHTLPRCLETSLCQCFTVSKTGWMSCIKSIKNVPKVTKLTISSTMSNWKKIRPLYSQSLQDNNCSFELTDGLWQWSQTGSNCVLVKYGIPRSEGSKKSGPSVFLNFCEVLIQSGHFDTTRSL